MKHLTRRQQLTSGLAVTLVVTVTVLAGFILALTDRSAGAPVVTKEETATTRAEPTQVPTATIADEESTNVVPEVTAFDDEDEDSEEAPSATPTRTLIPTWTPVPPTTVRPTTSAPPVATMQPDTIEPASQDMALIPTSTGTQTPLEGACNNNESFIHTPLNQTILSGVVTFTGNAQTPNFSYYKLEIRKDSELEYDLFTTFLTEDRPVWHGVLGTLDTRAFENGWYWIRLVVVDDTGNYPERCAWYYPIIN